MSQSLPQLLRRALPRYNNNHNNNGLDKLSPRLRIQRCRTVHIPRPFSTSPPRPYLAQLLSALPAPLVPPVVFIGLALSLWAYKCLMMVVFQNKIIYMPSMPPFSRSERIEDYRGMCGGVGWEEGRIRSGDGVEIAVCTGRIPAEVEADAKKKKKHVVVLYFQGNGSSTPPRLPQLSSILTRLHPRSDSDTAYTIVAVSYRGYWTSRGRASQAGIERDAIAALQYIQTTYPEETTRYVLWGQSVGAGVATGLVAHHAEESFPQKKKIHGVILETPFVSMKGMLLAMYPQKWLPYRHLWPFLRSWWDSEDAVRRVGRRISTGDTLWLKSLPVLLVSAAKDELVPPGQAGMLERLCRDAGMVDVSRVEVSGALHNEATVKGEGRAAVVQFLNRIGEDG